MRGTVAALLLLLALGSPSGAQAPRAGFGRHAVASDHALASAAGAELLAGGGNAADAAAATMLTLGVVSPGSSGLGGGGFALYYEASSGTVTFLDFREAAPAAATPDMFDAAPPDAAPPDAGPASTPSQLGGLATGVPGEPAGIAELVRRFGSRPLSEIAAPAIRHAERGFEVTPYLAALSVPFAEQMGRDPLLRSWLDDGSRPLRPGQSIRNRALARTLRAFASSGANPFYRGVIAREIVRQNRRAGGLLAGEDLARYRVIERAPLSGQHLGLRWVTAPPPSAGGYTLLSSLALLEHWIPESHRASARGDALMHAFAESWKGAFWDRARYFGDPDHATVPVDALLSSERAALRSRTFRPALAIPVEAWGTPLGPHAPAPSRPPGTQGTSHLCVVDSAGNVAAVTTTVNLPFGARYTAAGMVMNDEMDDFASALGAANAFGLPGGPANQPGPGKRPVSSMTPTIVFDGDRPVLCIGAAGGSRIPTAVVQVAWHVLMGGLDPAAAIARPRVHHQGIPRELSVEEAFPPDDRDVTMLRARGHVIEIVHHSAVVQVIQLTGGRLLAASDPRKGGAPAGE